MRRKRESIQYYQMLPYLRSADDRLLPLITVQHLLFGLIVMIALKMALKRLVKGLPIEQVCSQRTRVELEDQYYYHLGTVLVLVATVSWNAYDFYFWLGCYVAIGILRKTVNDLTSSQNTFLQSLGFDNQIKSLLEFSRRVAFCIIVLSTAVICGAIILFCHSGVPVIGVFLYPTWRLVVDSLHLFVRSTTILKHLPYFYNNNIDGYSPISEYGFFHNAMSAILKILHFGKLLCMVPHPSSDFFFLVHAPWIVLLLWEFFQGFKQLAIQMIGYYEFKWLARRTDESFHKLYAKSDICTICREELIVSRRIQCGHQFHFKCIFRWIANRSENECPICRSDIIKSINRRRTHLSKIHY